VIRAGREHLVWTLADLAAAAGKKPKTFSNQGLHKQPGHPEPISSPQARVLLWDAEQVTAYQQGKPVPGLAVEEDDQDLLDRNEAAEMAGVVPRTWDRYANLPGMQPRPDLVVVAGVEHWRRGEITRWLAGRPGLGSSPGRPAGSKKQAPRRALGPAAARLLRREPDITAAGAAAELGVSHGTAQRALAMGRTQAVSRLLRENPQLTAEDVQAQLGYPLWAARRAGRGQKRVTVRAGSLPRAVGRPRLEREEG